MTEADRERHNRGKAQNFAMVAGGGGETAEDKMRNFGARYSVPAEVIRQAVSDVTVSDTVTEDYLNLKDKVFGVTMAADIPTAPDIVSCRELAILLGYDKGNLHKILAGNRDLPFQLGCRLAATLRLPGLGQDYGYSVAVYRLKDVFQRGNLALLNEPPLNSPVKIHMARGYNGGRGKRAATIRAEKGTVLVPKEKP